MRACGHAAAISAAGRVAVERQVSFMPKFTPILILSLPATLLMVGVGMIVALLPQRVHTMTGTLEGVGLTASAFALAYLLAQLPIGILSDRLGAKRFLVFGYLLCGASGLVFFAAQSAGSVYLGRVIQGFGEAPVWALGPALLSLAYPAAKGHAIGIYNAAIHAGLTAGPLLGLVIMPSGESGVPFLVFTALCFGAAAIIQIFLSDNRLQARHSTTSARQFLAILRQRRPLVILAGILLYGAAYGVFASVLPISLTTLNAFDATAIGILFAVFYAAISLAQIVVGFLSDRIGRDGFMWSGMLAAAVGLGAFPLFSGYWVYAPLGLASIGLGAFCVTSIAALQDGVPDDAKGAVSGSYYFFWGSGYVLGPILTGALASRAPTAGYLVLAVLLGMHAVVLRVIRE